MRPNSIDWDKFKEWLINSRQEGVDLKTLKERLFLQTGVEFSVARISQKLIKWKKENN